ncbi:VOC family protein [Kineococcus sp. SYSU DK003]|uniref:VOC family protein n=1 Tax=Kineococcus sp. SYSU DK003 TaxID=3383124 RepID=UPI003D7D7364
MELTSCYPVLLSRDVAAARDCLTRWFGFEVVFDSGWYASLRHRSAPSQEIAVVAHDHPTVPAAYRRTARGVVVNLEVTDVDAQWQRMVVEGGLEPALELRSEDFGQRHFIVAGPEGLLVDVITPIPPAGEFADA